MDTRKAARARRSRLEQAHAAAPGRFRLRLLLWAALGHVLLVAGLLLCLGILLAIAWLLVRGGARDWTQGWVFIPCVVLLATCATLGRALWLRFEPPAGVRLAPGEAPALQAEVERIRRAVGARPLEGIYLNAELNAAAVYVPRAAGLAGAHHYLVLGLPMLQLLDRDELAAVIAHEFGHFHGGDSRFSNWVYRARIGWHRIGQDLARRPFSSQIFLMLFLRWYLPRLDDASLVVSRQQELAADALAARMAGAAASASSLVRIHLADDWLRRCFWPEVESAARGQAYPPVHVYARLREQLQQHRAAPRRIPARLLERDAHSCDTHPTLARRLVALAAPAVESVAGTAPAAADLLLEPELHERLQRHFSQAWQEEIRAEWRERHRRLQDEGARLEALERQPSRTPGQIYEYARLLEVHRPDATSAALYAEVLEALPAHPAATGQLGLALLRAGRHAEGEAALRRALALDASGTEGLVSALHDLQASRPDDRALQTLDDALYTLHLAADEEEDADLVGHALEPAQLAALAQLLSSEARIARAWIVHRGRTDPLLPPHHLLLVLWKGSVASEVATLPRLAARLSGPGTIALLGTDTDRALARRIRATAGAPFHQRP